MDLLRLTTRMPEGCIFCKIAMGEVDADVVYRDEHTCAFLDAHPLAQGHTLVVPLLHITRLGRLNREQAAAHLSVLPRIVEAVTRGTEAEGATVAWNDGGAAGQEVPHLHAHVIPRTDRDDFGPIHGLFTTRPKLSHTEMKHIRDRISLGLEH